MGSMENALSIQIIRLLRFHLKMVYCIMGFRKNEKVQVPIIKYRDTIVRQNGEEIEPELTEIGSIMVDSVNGKNTIHVSYNAPKYVYFSVIISIVSFAITVILVLFRSYGQLLKKMKLHRC